MSNEETREAVLEGLYEAYNRRDVPSMVAALDPCVEWMDMLKGEPIKGREAVGAYWTQQFGLMDAEVTPVAMDRLPDGRIVVTAAQTLKKPGGGLWSSDKVTHVITFGKDGLILRMDAS